MLTPNQMQDLKGLIKTIIKVEEEHNLPDRDMETWRVFTTLCVQAKFVKTSAAVIDKLTQAKHSLSSIETELETTCSVPKNKISELKESLDTIISTHMPTDTNTDHENFKIK